MNLLFTLFFSHMISSYTICIVNYIFNKDFMIFIKTNQCYYIYFFTFLLVSVYSYLFIN